METFETAQEDTSAHQKQCSGVATSPDGTAHQAGSDWLLPLESRRSTELAFEPDCTRDEIRHLGYLCGYSRLSLRVESRQSSKHSKGRNCPQQIFYVGRSLSLILIECIRWPLKPLLSILCNTLVNTHQISCDPTCTASNLFACAHGHPVWR